MQKQDYIDLLKDKPWQEMEDYFDKLPKAEVKKITTLDIDTDKWIQFTIDNFADAQQKWEEPKPDMLRHIWGCRTAIFEQQRTRTVWKVSP